MNNSTPKTKMVTPAEAEVLAAAAIQRYMNACNLQTTEDAGNALMKLVSSAGVVMAAVVGAEDAANRLLGTSEFVRKQGRHVKVERAQ